MSYRFATDLRSHLAPQETCRNALRNAGAAFWPEATPPQSPSEQVPLRAEYLDREPPYILYLSVADGDTVNAGGTTVTAAGVRVDISFEDDDWPDEDVRAEAMAHADAVRDQAMAVLRDTVPVTTVHHTFVTEGTRLPLVTLATVMADMLGDGEIFASLAEMREWTGTVYSNGIPVTAHLQTPHAGDGDLSSLECSVAVSGAELHRAGIETAQAATDALAADLRGAYEDALRGVAPTVYTATLVADLPEVPATFFGSSTLADEVREGTSMAADHEWGADVPMLIQALDDGTRAKVEIRLDHVNSGHLQASVTAEIQRAGQVPDAVVIEEWQRRVGMLGEMLAHHVTQQPPALSFVIAAPVERLRPYAAAYLAQAFPGASPVVDDTDVRIAGVELADDVYGGVTIHLEPIDEWRSRITFTGELWGAGLERARTPFHIARWDYHRSVAGLADQLRSELLSEFGAPPPTAPHRGGLE